LSAAAISSECESNLQLATYKRMADSDQLARKLFFAAQGRQERENAIEQIEQVDRSNIAELKSLLTTCGWPRKEDLESSVGAAAAALIIIHADFDLQLLYAPLLERSYANSEISTGAYVAFLTRVQERTKRRSERK
jgi:hypothetical protein